MPVNAAVPQLFSQAVHDSRPPLQEQQAPHLFLANTNDPFSYGDTYVGKLATRIRSLDSWSFSYFQLMKGELRVNPKTQNKDAQFLVDITNDEVFLLDALKLIFEKQEDSWLSLLKNPFLCDALKTGPKSRFMLKAQILKRLLGTPFIQIIKALYAEGQVGIDVQMQKIEQLINTKKGADLAKIIDNLLGVLDKKDKIYEGATLYFVCDEEKLTLVRTRTTTEKKVHTCLKNCARFVLCVLALVFVFVAIFWLIRLAKNRCCPPPTNDNQTQPQNTEKLFPIATLPLKDFPTPLTDGTWQEDSLAALKTVLEGLTVAQALQLAKQLNNNLQKDAAHVTPVAGMTMVSEYEEDPCKI